MFLRLTPWSVTGKKDAWNGIYGGLAAGGVLGLTLRSLPVGMGAAAALAVTSFSVDLSGEKVVGAGMINDGATPPRQIYPYAPRSSVPNEA